MNPATSNFLNASRWIAAFFVVLGHTYNISTAKYNYADHPDPLFHGLHFMSGFGHIAVMVFFVISGFLVGGPAILNISKGKKFNSKDFFIHRFSRIYTVLIPALVVGGMLDWVGIKYFNMSGTYSHPESFYTNPLGNDITEHLNLHIFIENLLQLQTISVSVLGSNGPLWSLANEWWYYVMFGLGMIALHPGRPLNRIIAIGVVLGMVIMLPATISLWFLLWGIGVGVAVLDRYWTGWPFFAGAIIMVACFIAMRWLDAWLISNSASSCATDLATDTAIALSYSMALICAKNLKQPLRLRSLHHRLASFSYTVYLVHFPAMVFVAALMKEVLDIGIARQPSVATMIYLLALIAFLYGYAWVFAVFTEAHTRTIRSWLGVIVLDMLPRSSSLKGAGETEARALPFLRR